MYIQPIRLMRVYTPRTTGGLLPTTGASRTQGTRSSQSSRILTVKLGLSTASAHCPSLKAKPDPRQKELAALIRKRDKTSNLSEYSSLDKQVKALRAQMVPNDVVAATQVQTNALLPSAPTASPFVYKFYIVSERGALPRRVE